MTVLHRLNWIAALTGFVVGLGLSSLIGHTWPVVFFALTGGAWPIVSGLIGALMLIGLHRHAAAFVSRWAAREPVVVNRRLAWAWLPVSLVGLNLVFESHLICRWLPGDWSGIDVSRGWLLFGAGVLLAAMLTGRLLSRSGVLTVPRWLLPMLFGGLALVIYLRTTSAHVGQADTFEFQVTAYSLGVAHQTGYSLYVLLGHAFAWLIPVGSVAWRVNLTAVLPAMAVIGGVVWLSRRQGAGSIGAVLAGLLLAFSLTFWQAAAAAEVYALHALLVLVVLGSLCTLIAGQRDSRPVYALAAAVGLGLSHHLTIILLLPAIAVALLVTRPRLTARQWLAAGSMGLAGATITLYIPLRWPAITGQAMTLEGFFAYVTGQQYAGALQWSQVLDPVRWAVIARIVLAQFGPFGVGLAFLGLVLTMRQRPLWGLASSLAAAPFFVYGLAYNVPDVDVFLLPAILVAAIWIAFGISWLVDDLPARLYLGRWTENLSVLVVTSLTLLPLGILAANWVVVDRSVGDGGESWARDVIAETAENAVILADGEKIAPLEYVRRVEGLGPARDIIVRFQEAGYRESLYAALADGRPVYLARYLPDLQGQFYLSSAGPVVAVRTEPPPPPGADFLPVDVVFGGEVVLAAVRLVSTIWQEGQALPLTLAWRRAGDISTDYEIRLRLRPTGAESPVWQEAAYAAGGMYPANAWKPGEYVYDYHTIPLGYGLAAAQPLLLEVGVFEPYALEGLPLADGHQWHLLAEVDLQFGSDPPAPQIRIDQPVMPGLLLLGYDRVTGNAPLTLHWLALASGDYTPTLSLLPEDGAAGVEEMPTTTVALGDLAAGVQRVTRHLLDATCLAGECPDRQVLVNGLAMFHLSGNTQPDGLANFAGLFVLDTIDLSVDRARPGEMVPVTAAWTAVAASEEDYTVFVQAIGPDGDLWGQVDRYPLQGTLATSMWQPGERIVDSYDLRLRSDAPPGRYHVIVGFYLLRTGDRLDVIGEGGLPLADHYTIGTVTVYE